jgi:hypothetical protein
MSNIKIKLDSLQIKLTPTLFRKYANQHFECEMLFRSSASAGYSPLPYYLLCKAIELELKARHLESNNRESVRKLYGHNLLKLYDALPTVEQTLDSSERATLACASNIYDISGKKGFEYVSVHDVVTAYERFPDLEVLRRIVQKLLLLTI